jgi:hypothetical protein
MRGLDEPGHEMDRDMTRKSNEEAELKAELIVVRVTEHAIRREVARASSTTTDSSGLPSTISKARAP